MNDETESPKALTRLVQHVAQQGFPAATLYVTATPLGNTGDISLRALHVLGMADAIACEDTRTTGALLAHYGISRELLAVHEHNENRAATRIVERLRRGERIALVSDAGTPAISDPGARVVDAVLSAGLRVVPVAGPCAATAALSVGGLAADHFYFAGFLPARTAARENAIRALAGIPATLVFYEAPHRITETLESLKRILGEERRIVIAREISKLFEEIHRSALADISGWMASSPNHARGEFVILVEGASSGTDTDEAEAGRILEILLSELPPSQAASLAARITGIRKNRLYERALQMKEGKA